MKLGLQAKMGLSILTPAIVGLMLVAGVCYKMSEEVLREQIRTDMTALLESQSIGLNAVFQGLDDGMKTMSENQRIRDQIGAYAHSPDEAYEGALFNRADEALKSFVENNQSVYFAGLIALDGKVLGYRQEKQTERSKYVGSDFSDRGYFKKSREGKTAVAGYYNPATGDAATVLAVPVTLNGQIAAVLFGGVDNKTLGDATTSKIKIGSKGKMYVYDAQGRVVLNPDQAALGRDESRNPIVRQVLETKQGRTRFVDAKGDEKGLYYSYMPEEGWYLCVEFDREETFQPISKLLANASLLTVVCALIVGVIIFFSARSIVRMVGGISGLAGAVAHGRLEIDNKERSLLDGAQRRRDEFSTLAAGMEQMMGSIRQLLGESEQKTQAAQQATEVAEKATAKAEQAARQAENAKREGMLTAAGQLEDVVGVISSASSELAAQIEQSDRSAVESSHRLGEAATAMNEMNATVQEVARNASSASAVSVETKNNAESGAHIVESALQSIGQVQKVSLALKDDMAQLNEHAKAISQIMSVISDIADQTNLLALNAAIEAARAGEAGRGFAVVADEVRKLAEKTMASTNDVGNAISAIQNSAAQSVTAMDKALAEVEIATDFASQSGEALRQIVSNVEATADQVSAIATASEQQSAASEEINQSIVVVNDMSGQTAAAMSEASKAVSELAQQAQRLSSLIDEMKRG